MFPLLVSFILSLPFSRSGLSRFLGEPLGDLSEEMGPGTCESLERGRRGRGDERESPTPESPRTLVGGRL